MAAFRTLFLPFFLAFLLVSCAAPKGNTLADKRRSVNAMRAETLAKLYQKRPEAKELIRNSAGYGVFSNINTNLFLVSTAHGYGVVHDNRTGRDVYMKMGQVGVGPGLGLKDFRLVLVFRSRQVLDQFVSKGWEFGGHADATAKSGEKGGGIGAEAYFDRDIVVFQLTEAGAALQATISGTKYWPDKDLN